MHAARILLIAACLQFVPEVRAADIEQCGAGRVELEASTATPTDLRLACEAVSIGVEFLRSLGFDSDVPVRLKVVDELPAQHGIALLGQYDPKVSEIRILSLSQFLLACADHPPFGCPLTAEIYRSFVVHEVVHALTDLALAGRVIPRLQMEYLAYVAQLASLPDALRERVIAASGVGGFEREDDINAFVYFAAPNRFGIMCYLHYLRPENGNAYLQKILGTKETARTGEVPAVILGSPKAGHDRVARPADRLRD